MGTPRLSHPKGTIQMDDLPSTWSPVQWWYTQSAIVLSICVTFLALDFQCSGPPNHIRGIRVNRIFSTNNAQLICTRSSYSTFKEHSSLREPSNFLNAPFCYLNVDLDQFENKASTIIHVSGNIRDISSSNILCLRKRNLNLSARVYINSLPSLKQDLVEIFSKHAACVWACKNPPDAISSRAYELSSQKVRAPGAW